MDGKHFCQQHELNEKARLKHGLITVPLADTQDNRKRLLMTLQPAERKLRWYSRDKLWEYAGTHLHLDNVADMTDAQYMEALRFVDRYFATHASAVRRMRLMEQAGPQSVEDRGSDAEDYTGIVNDFYYFHRDIFNGHLERLAPGVHLDDVSERFS